MPHACCKHAPCLVHASYLYTATMYAAGMCAASMLMQADASIYAACMPHVRCIYGASMLHDHHGVLEACQAYIGSNTLANAHPLQRISYNLACNYKLQHISCNLARSY